MTWVRCTIVYSAGVGGGREHDHNTSQQTHKPHNLHCNNKTAELINHHHSTPTWFSSSSDPWFGSPSRDTNAIFNKRREWNREQEPKTTCFRGTDLCKLKESICYSLRVQVITTGKLYKRLNNTGYLKDYECLLCIQNTSHLIAVKRSLNLVRRSCTQRHENSKKLFLMLTKGNQRTNDRYAIFKTVTQTPA